ncbi:MAG TPA: type II 3-dehydroquinate dehydratase, partial [Rhizomicrobium sp.]|nr:type II 3-dehydroquinate dehydratase [Rhizomicrobium sp.]
PGRSHAGTMSDIIYVINGPNLNLLGTREPEKYGRATLADVEALCREAARRHGLAVEFRQSNREGDLVDWIQEAGKTKAAGIILNAAAYTHTSVAILDALQMLTLPVIEVHLSNPARREEYRHLSYVAKAATGSITGLGMNSYLLAIDAVAAILAGPKGSKK